MRQKMQAREEQERQEERGNKIGSGCEKSGRTASNKRSKWMTKKDAASKRRACVHLCALVHVCTHTQTERQRQGCSRGSLARWSASRNEDTGGDGERERERRRQRNSLSSRCVFPSQANKQRREKQGRGHGKTGNLIPANLIVLVSGAEQEREREREERRCTRARLVMRQEKEPTFHFSFLCLSFLSSFLFLSLERDTHTRVSETCESAGTRVSSRSCTQAHT